MNNSKNVLNYLFGRGAFSRLGELLAPRREKSQGKAVFFVDHYFMDKELPKKLPLRPGDQLLFVDTTEEPSTDDVDAFTAQVKAEMKTLPCALVGIGGGITLDVTKAVSNLLTNGGAAADYQGWDLVKVPGVYKIGVPTLSGTGAEASRTCVMMNLKKNLKLGMNSEHTIYDQLLLDPDLTRTVPRDQYFYSGMDTYIHCVESMAGAFRHPVGDAFSVQSLELCREVFLSEDMLSDANREKVMVASYFGGCAIANSFVGVVHPVSAALSVVFGTHHCVANCIVMNQMDDFYPKETEEFRRMLKKQRIELPKGLCRGLSDEQFERLHLSTVIHEKPLRNALGDGYKDILTRERTRKLFERM